MSAETRPCPAVTDAGIPCQKGLYHARNGEWWDHAGGHWFMTANTAACMDADHFDPVDILSLRPLRHLDVRWQRRAVRLRQPRPLTRWMAVKGGALRVVKPAPKLRAEPMPKTMTAAFLRAVAYTNRSPS